jgi:hypothetical protein
VRRAIVIVALAFAACSSGSPVIPAGFRGPVAVAAFMGRNPEAPEVGLVPLIAVASFRGDELRLVDANTDAPIAARNFSWALSIPTVQRPTYLAAGSLHDGLADVLVVASSAPLVQIVGTWMDGANGYGVAASLDLSGVVGAGSQILSLVVAAVPSGPLAGTPPVAPPTPGRAWIVVGLGDPGGAATGQLVVLEVARQPDGSIALAASPLAKPLGFTPAGMAAAPDNVHLYLATRDPIQEPSGRSVFGVAEVDASAGLSAAWPFRGLDARNAPTTFVAAAFVGERTQANFYTYGQPALRVYAALDASGCGAERDIACGIATFDPELGGLAADPAVPGPPGWIVPVQSYRTPMFVSSIPLAMGIAPPALVPAPAAPSTPYGSQVCYAPVTPGVPYPGCPSVTEETPQKEFNRDGVGQKFMLLAPPTGQLWTSVTALVPAVDGLAYVQDLGRFGVVNATSMLGDETMKTQAGNATPVGPLGPYSGTSLFGFPPGTSAVGLWLDHPTTSHQPIEVVSTPDGLKASIIVWPGFTKDDHWLVSFQGVLPGMAQRRSVLGLSPDGTLYLAIQGAALPSVEGVLPASSYWVTGAIVNSPDLGIHSAEKEGLPGDIGLFLLDSDPCPSTRPNWIPLGQTTPVYDPTQFPVAHEVTVLSLLDPDPLLYPGGALRIGPAADAAMASEYACLVDWFRQPGHSDVVLTAFRNFPPVGDYPRGTWVRAGGFLLAGVNAGYAGRPLLDVRYDLAWSDEDGLSGEARVLARKARRYYYPSAYPNHPYNGFPEMDDPMEPGPVVGFRLGRFCPVGLSDCDPLTSPPARDAGVNFFTQSGLEGMSRRPSSTSTGNAVISFDKSTIPDQEYRGRVFYGTYVGDLLMMIPPGLDVGQTVSIR